MPRIMLVDDDDTVKIALEASLISMGYDVIGQADSGEQAVRMARDLKPDLILMDIVMSGHMDGISAAERIRSELDVAIVFLTGYGDPEYVERAKRVEPFGYVMKPWTDEEIRASVEVALCKKEMELRLEKAYERLERTNLDLQEEIATRKKTERTLRESEERWQFALEGSRDGVWDWNAVSNEVFFSIRWKEILGYKEDEISSHLDEWDKRVHPDDKEQCYAKLNKHFEGELPYYENEYRMLCKDGSYKWILDRGKIISWTKANKPHRVIGTHTDISERKRAEEVLRESDEKYRNLVENINDVIVSLDVTGTVTYISPTIETIIGYSPSEIIGKQMMEFIYPDDHPALEERFRELILSGRIKPYEYRLFDKSGNIRWVKSSSRPIIRDGKISGVQGVLTDITQTKEMEEQLRQAQKMEAIATLAGGIAHDYNNLLAVIMGNLSMAREEAAPHSAMAELLHEIEQASCKARDLTHQFLTLSHGEHPRKEPGSMESLLKEILGQAHEVSTASSIQDDLWPVEYDSKQMHFAISNVIKNAVDAMPRGGTITVQAENRIIDNKEKDPALPLNEGRYVRISIKDEGPGIPEEHMGKVFDPYFSTKARGVQKGMGLGLTAAYAVVEKHGGHITLSSTIGVGTTVTIYLPAAAPESKAKRTERPEPGPQSSIANQQSSIPRILVMDDEESLRTLAQKMLERLGYEVETVKDGAEAIETYKKHMDSGETFDGVILDLTIKDGMGGVQAIKELIKIDPDVKAIVCSGYFNDPVMSDFEKYGFMGAVAKPYGKKTLEETLAKLFK